MNEKTPKNPLTPRDFQSAIDSQSACNAAGLINSLARILPGICEEARETGTHDVNNHPIIKLYVEQLVHLSRDIEYSKAYNICEIQAKRAA